MLEKVGNWNFDIFLFDRLTNGESAEAARMIHLLDKNGGEIFPLLPPSGNSLITLTFHLLNQYGLVELFQLDRVKLWRFLVMVQEDYHSDNPYHNAVHAADVTQAMYCFIREPKVRLCEPCVFHREARLAFAVVTSHRLGRFLRSSPSR